METTVKSGLEWRDGEEGVPFWLPPSRSSLSFNSHFLPELDLQFLSLCVSKKNRNTGRPSASEPREHLRSRVCTSIQPGPSYLFQSHRPVSRHWSVRNAEAPQIAPASFVDAAVDRTGSISQLTAAPSPAFVSAGSREDPSTHPNGFGCARDDDGG